jgi:hypothetical protein
MKIRKIKRIEFDDNDLSKALGEYFKIDHRKIKKKYLGVFCKTGYFIEVEE